MMLARDVTWPDTLVTLVAKNEQNLRWPTKCLNLNPIDHLLDLLKSKVYVQPLQLNLRELTRVIHQICAAIPQQYIHRQMLSIFPKILQKLGGQLEIHLSVH